MRAVAPSAAPAGAPAFEATLPALESMTPGDLDAVLAIEQAVYEFPWTRGNFLDALKAGYACFVWPDDTDDAAGATAGSLAAYAVQMTVLDEVHLLDIAVAPHRQRQGLGRACLRALYRVAQSGGAQTMLLEVRPSNLGAIGLYRSEGFAEVGRRRGYYPARQGREDALLFTRAL